MKSHSLISTLFLAVLGLPVLAAEVAPVLAAAEPGSTARVTAFAENLLGAQPAADDLALAHERGIRTIINLRMPAEPAGFDEAAEAERLGLTYHRVPWNGSPEEADAVFSEVRRLLNQTREPLLLHCASGNRVGAAWIPWRVLDGGVPLETAVAEAKTIGLKTLALEELARDYVRRNQLP
jgi:uncharacterized protein (TIGR01244 family)